jgi:hypothetical protein
MGRNPQPPSGDNGDPEPTFEETLRQIKYGGKPPTPGGMSFRKYLRWLRGDMQEPDVEPLDSDKVRVYHPSTGEWTSETRTRKPPGKRAASSGKSLATTAADQERHRQNLALGVGSLCTGTGVIGLITLLAVAAPAAVSLWDSAYWRTLWFPLTVVFCLWLIVVGVYALLSIRRPLPSPAAPVVAACAAVLLTLAPTFMHFHAGASQAPGDTYHFLSMDCESGLTTKQPDYFFIVTQDRLPTRALFRQDTSVSAGAVVGITKRSDSSQYATCTVRNNGASGLLDVYLGMTDFVAKEHWFSGPYNTGGLELRRVDAKARVKIVLKSGIPKRWISVLPTGECVAYVESDGARRQCRFPMPIVSVPVTLSPATGLIKDVPFENGSSVIVFPDYQVK